MPNLLLLPHSDKKSSIFMTSACFSACSGQWTSLHRRREISRVGHGIVRHNHTCHHSTTSTDSKGRLELSKCASQFAYRLVWLNNCR